MLGALQTFAGEWLPAGLAVLAFVGAAVAYFRLPLFGKEAATALVAVGAGLLAWRAGYTTRAEQDHSAELQARIETLNADIASAKKAAADASIRAVSLDAARSAAEDRVSQYERYLATRPPADAAPGAALPATRPDDSCALGPDDIGWLRGAGPVHGTKPSAAP